MKRESGKPTAKTENVKDNPTETSELAKDATNRPEAVGQPDDSDEDAVSYDIDVLFEYKWPRDVNGEHYLLVEQVTEFLKDPALLKKYPGKGVFAQNWFITNEIILTYILLSCHLLWNYWYCIT